MKWMSVQGMRPGRRKSLRVNAGLLAAFLFLWGFSASSVRGERVVPKGSVHLRGSHTIVPIAQLVAESFMREYPDRIVSVQGGGTFSGIKAVVDCTAQIGMASADMSDELSRMVEAQGVELESYVIGYDALVPVVHPSNGVEGLSREQLREIFSGRIDNWKFLGGAEAPIEVASHAAGSGTYDVWMEAVMNDSIVTQKARILGSRPLKQYIAEHPNAVGYNAIAYTDTTVKVLTVDGVPGNKETIEGQLP